MRRTSLIANILLFILLQTVLKADSSSPEPINWEQSIISPFNSYIADDVFRIRAPGPRWQWQPVVSEQADSIPVHTLVCQDPVTKIAFILMVIDTPPEGKDEPDSFASEFIQSASQKIETADEFNIYNLQLFKQNNQKTFRFQANVTFPDSQEGFWIGYITHHDRYYVTQFLGRKKTLIPAFRSFQHSLKLMR